jgi:hypothetical protein
MRIERVERENPTPGAGRRRLGRVLGIACMFGVVAGGAHAQEPTLIVGDATGIQGAPVLITISLQGGGARAVTADLDLLFPANILSPVVDPNSGVVDCAMASGVTDHQLTAVVNPPNDLPPEGQTKLRLGLFDLSPPPTTVLPDGDLITCAMKIASDAPLGQVALVAEKLQLAEGEPTFLVLCGEGSDNPCGQHDGTVTVENAPTQTPTETSTEVPPTSTPTLTPVPPTPTLTPVPPTATLTPVPPTATHTNAPTVTKTTAATPTATPHSGGGGGGDCSIAPTHETSPTGILLLFGGSLLLVWARRRHR